MKNNKFKIFISFFTLIAIFSVAGIVAAAGGVYVIPASAIKNIGNNFDVSVAIDSTTSKVYAVEGTLVFNKLTCKSITVADGITAQTAPTCTKHYFLLGIPNGTTTGKVLFTASVTADNAGVASLGFTGVDIIGEGVSIGSASTSGIYTINSVIPAPVEKVETTKPVQKVDTLKVDEEPIVETDTTTEEKSSLAAAAGEAVPSSGGNKWILILLGIIVLGGFGYGMLKYKKK